MLQEKQGKAAWENAGLLISHTKQSLTSLCAATSFAQLTAGQGKGPSGNNRAYIWSLALIEGFVWDWICSISVPTAFVSLRQQGQKPFVT